MRLTFPFIAGVVVSAVIAVVGFSVIGTEGRVEQIKATAPQRLKEANFTILRYDGYQRSSWSEHGGRCWYHVVDNTNHDIRYRVYVTLWGSELHLYYDNPEPLPSPLKASLSK